MIGILVQPRRKAKAATRVFGKPVKQLGEPPVVVTVKLSVPSHRHARADAFSLLDDLTGEMPALGLKLKALLDPLQSIWQDPSKLARHQMLIQIVAL